MEENDSEWQCSQRCFSILQQPAAGELGRRYCMTAWTLYSVIIALEVEQPTIVCTGGLSTWAGRME